METHGPEGLQISIIVPTLNEGRNLPALLTRLHQTLSNYRYEVLIVDDGSTDETSQICQELARHFPVQLLVRLGSSDGLSGAVLYGMKRASGALLVVMDADLQHPPEHVPDLLKPLLDDQADFVIGSRYTSGGVIDNGWSSLRRANSRIATLLARPFAGQTRDPMSGFFALRRSTYRQGSEFNPIGYKIALELICKCKVRRVREVPIRFALREEGESKLNLAQQVHYFDHLSRLYDYSFPRAATWAKFVIATGIAWFVAFGLYVRLVAQNASPVLAPTLAFAAAALTTAAFHHRFLRRHGDAARRKRDWADFGVLIVAEWLVCTCAARWVSAHVVPMSAIQFFGVVFGMVAAARYALRIVVLRDLRGVRFTSDQAATARQPDRPRIAA